MSDTYKTAKIYFITSWAEDIIRTAYYILGPRCDEINKLNVFSSSSSSSELIALILIQLLVLVHENITGLDVTHCSECRYIVSRFHGIEVHRNVGRFE